MKKQQSGFTLIELIMVIVILGVLGATAIPKFTDLSGQAQAASTAGIAGALGAASAINLSVCSIDSGLPNCTLATDNCTNVAALLDGGLDGNYTITAGAIVDGATAACVVTGPTGAGVGFTGHNPTG